MKDEITNKVRDAFNNINLPNKNKLWEKLNTALDDSKDKKVVFIWNRKKYLLLSGLLLLVGIAGYCLLGTFKEKSAGQNRIAGNSSEKINPQTIEKTLPQTDTKEKATIEKNSPEVFSKTDEDIKSGNTYTSIRKKEIANDLFPIITNPLSDNLIIKTHRTTIISEGITDKSSLKKAKLKKNNIEKEFDISLIVPINNATAKPKTTKKDSGNISKKLQFSIQAGLAFNNFTFTNFNKKPLDLLSIGLEAKYFIKNKTYLRSIISFNNEAMDIEFYDLAANNNFKALKINNCKNMQLAFLVSQKKNNWHFDGGLYLGYTFSLNGNSSYYQDLQSFNESKRIIGTGFISSEKLDKQMINESFFKRSDYGIRLGCGYQFSKVNINLGYSFGFRDYIDYENFFKGQNTFNPHRNFYLSAGYRLY